MTNTTPPAPTPGVANADATAPMLQNITPFTDAPPPHALKHGATPQAPAASKATVATTQQINLSQPKPRSKQHERWNAIEKLVRDLVTNDPDGAVWAAGRLAAFQHEAYLGFTVLKGLPGLPFPGKWKGAQYQITHATAQALLVNEGFCLDNTGIKSVQNLGILCGPASPDGSGGNGVLGIDVDVKGVVMPMARPKANAPWEEVYAYIMSAEVMHKVRDNWIAGYVALNPDCNTVELQDVAWQQWLMGCKIVLTPSGGFHLYTRVEGDDCGLSVSAGKLYADDGSVIDIRWTSVTGKVGQLAGPTSRTIDRVDASGAITKAGGRYVTIWGNNTDVANLAVVQESLKRLFAGPIERRVKMHGTDGLLDGETKPAGMFSATPESAKQLTAKVVYFLDRWDEELERDPTADHPFKKRHPAFFSVMMAFATAVRDGTGITLAEAFEAFEAICRYDVRHFDEIGLDENLYQLEQAAESYDGVPIRPDTIHAMADHWKHIFDAPQVGEVQ